MSELWQMPPRSVAAQAIYRQAEEERQRSSRNFDLSVSSLAENADLSPGLIQLATSARTEARLNAFGARAMRRMILAMAQKRRLLDELLETQPDIAERPIIRPIFIVGGWRTGSTLLHRLMAQIPSLRAPKFWEWSAPIVAADGSREQQQKVIKKADAAFDLQYLLNPAKQIVHGAGAELPEECSVGFGSDGLNWAFATMAWMPSYSRYLHSQDFSEAYRYHKLQLQILQGVSPCRWVLKAPVHTPELETLLQTYPDAMIVHLHRDPAANVASAANLFAVFQASYSDQVDALSLGRHQKDTLFEWYRRLALVHSKHPQHFVNVVFQDLIGNPLAVAAKILTAVDHPFELPALQDYLSQQHRRDRQTMPYSAAQFGLKEDALRQEFARFQDY